MVPELRGLVVVVLCCFQRRRAQAAGGRTEGLYMRLDETKIAATRGVDWHGNDVRTLGSQWNQWESGAGTGGGKVRAYKTDEYLHGENLHTSDESQDSEEEVAEERKTLVQKKRDKEKSPGLFPAPDLESWRWTATPGRVVGLVLSGRACSGTALIFRLLSVHTGDRKWWLFVPQWLLVPTLHLLLPSLWTTTTRSMTTLMN